ncbi:MAG: type II toxin-antitoxin system RelE/ParE family toxin [bacterium]
MKFQIRLTTKAEKDLLKIPSSHKEQILSALFSLADNPYMGKKLKGRLKDVYFYRIWPYRIIYRIYKNISLVVIVRIGHRQGIYR